MLGADKQGREHVNTFLTIDQWFGVEFEQFLLKQ